MGGEEASGGSWRRIGSLETNSRLLKRDDAANQNRPWGRKRKDNPVSNEGTSTIARPIPVVGPTVPLGSTLLSRA